VYLISIYYCSCIFICKLQRLENETRRANREVELSLDELRNSIKWPTLNERGDAMLPALLAANELNANVNYSLDVSVLHYLCRC
jgi:hypothetical protein